MELGGVGKAAGCGWLGRDLAATAAKLSLPVQKVLADGLGMSTEAVMPARAMAMLELLFLDERAIVTDGTSFCFSTVQDESDHVDTSTIRVPVWVTRLIWMEI